MGTFPACVCCPGGGCVTTITKRLLVTRRAKMALESVFPSLGLNSRRTAKNAIQRIYIKYGNTERLEMYAIQGQLEKVIHIYKQKGSLLKIYQAVTIWLQYPDNA